MLRQTTQALVAMRYPHDTWVLDEGNDDRVKAMCAELGAHYFTRADHSEYDTTSGRYATGTKHGNYNVWLAEIRPDRYDIIMNIDPDHIPVASYLERALGYFDDESVGYVQVAQVYYNQPASLVARGAAEESYTYYSSLQMSSYALGYPIVTGSHTVHRLAALQAVGGFAPHEADDLLITIMYRAAGWRGVYVPEDARARHHAGRLADVPGSTASMGSFGDGHQAPLVPEVGEGHALHGTDGELGARPVLSVGDRHCSRTRRV